MLELCEYPCLLPWRPALRVCRVVGVVCGRKTGQGREAKLCECVRVKPVIRGERIVDLDTRSVMRLRLRVVVVRLVQWLPRNASNVPAEGEQECIDGLEFLWRPNTVIRRTLTHSR